METRAYYQNIVDQCQNELDELYRERTVLNQRIEQARHDRADALMRLSYGEFESEGSTK